MCHDALVPVKLVFATAIAILSATSSMSSTVSIDDFSGNETLIDFGDEMVSVGAYKRSLDIQGVSISSKPIIEDGTHRYEVQDLVVTTFDVFTDTPETSGPNTLHDRITKQGRSSFSFFFSQEINRFGAWLHGGNTFLQSSSPTIFDVSAFDSLGNLIGTHSWYFESDPNGRIFGPGVFAGIEFSSNFSCVVVSEQVQNGQYTGIDDIRFESLAAAPVATARPDQCSVASISPPPTTGIIPLPAGLPLLLTGLGVLGFSRKRIYG